MRPKDLEKKIISLRRELAAAETELAQYVGRRSVEFENLFDLDEIQAIQDAFAQATGVASLITRPDGTPITRPSNFCDLCENVIRKTDKGLANCMKSDAALGRYNPKGPILQPCLSGGLWDGGASISAGGRHVANWLIGQVRNEYLDEARMRSYAREIGADETEFTRALNRVTVMSLDRFKQVGQALFLVANMLSWSAYQNLQLEDNIREIRASNSEVQHLKRFLSNIVDSMPSILVGVDSEGCVTHWNLRAASLTGVDRRSAQGRNLVDLLPELSGEMDKVRQAIERREPVRAEKVAEEVDGTTRFRDVSVYPLIANGVEGAVIRVDDVTERVRIEEMVIQSEKMLSLGGLTAGMAHEVNNPLSAILGSARLLEKRLLEDTPRNRATAEENGTTMESVLAYVESRAIPDMLRAIVESAERAGKTVTNMLSFSRKSDGRMVETDVADLLDRAVDLIRSGQDEQHHLSFKEIEFVREYGEGRPLVRCDAGLMEQVFFNILQNGAQAMAGALGGSGASPRFTLRCHGLGGDLRVEIEDNGPGMDEAISHRVFEPFFTTKEVGVGTGLGMSVAFFIVTEGHGGTMRVDSRPGKGARFVIELPAAG